MANMIETEAEASYFQGLKSDLAGGGVNYQNMVG